jgi:hypothetical protein
MAQMVDIHVFIFAGPEQMRLHKIGGIEAPAEALAFHVDVAVAIRAKDPAQKCMNPPLATVIDSGPIEL